MALWAVVQYAIEYRPYSRSSYEVAVGISEEHYFEDIAHYSGEFNELTLTSDTRSIVFSGDGLASITYLYDPEFMVAVDQSRAQSVTITVAPPRPDGHAVGTTDGDMHETGTYAIAVIASGTLVASDDRPDIPGGQIWTNAGVANYVGSYRDPLTSYTDANQTPIDPQPHALWGVIEITGPWTEIFTIQGEAVNLDSLTPTQMNALALGAQTTDALAGNDTVTLPKTAEAADILGWQPGQTGFFAGAGNDTVTGGALSDLVGGGEGDDKLYGNGGNDTLGGGAGRDRLEGGAGDDYLVGGADDDTLIGGPGDPDGRDVLDGEGGDDILIAGPGDDDLSGGAGNDTFDYRSDRFSGWLPATAQALNGGANDGVASHVNQGMDRIALPFAPDNYEISVSFGDTWEATQTDIVVILPDGTQHRIGTSEIEKATFLAPVANVVHTDATGSTAFTSANLIVEMARLSREVYGSKDTLAHPKEALANEGTADAKAVYEDFAAEAVARGWHPLSALELGIKPADFGEVGSLRYSFVNGAYAAYDSAQFSPQLFFGGDKPEGNAMVLTGMVAGVRTLTIAFRGTDQTAADFLDYVDFDQHLAKFKPMLDAVRAYLADSANGIQQILLTGHSLGAGMVQSLMRQDGFSGANVKAYTFGSPGTDLSTTLTDSRLENFVHTDDLVPLFGEKASAALQPILAEGLAKFGGLGARALLAGIETKLRIGSDIRIDSNKAYSYGTDEHSMALYLETMQKLALRATEAGSPFLNLPVLSAFREGRTAVSIDYELSLGGEGDDTLVDGTERSLSGVTSVLLGHADQVMLAGGGNDTLKTGFDTTALGVPEASWKIDGGTGYDRLWIKGLDGARLTTEKAGAGYSFVYHPSLIGSHAFAEVHRVELVVLPDTAGPDVIIKLGGAPNVQTPGSTSAASFAAKAVASFAVDPSYDYADAGDGDLNVTGSSAGDIVLFGTGAKTAHGGDGADFLIARQAHSLGSDILTLFGEAGDDVLKGGAGGDFLDGGSDDDDLEGGDGVDTLIGGLGNDTLDGGTVADPATQGNFLLGGDGDDTYFVRNTFDLVDEGYVFPTAGFGGTDTLVSTANWYWDVYGIGERLIIAPDAADPSGAGTTLVGGVFDNELIGNDGTNILFGRGGSDTYIAGDGIDYISLSLLGVPTDLYAGVDGANTIVVDPRKTGSVSYDIIFGFDPAKDKVDVSRYVGAKDYKSAAEVLALGVDDGAGNSYFALGDGFDYLYMIGLTKAQMSASDFIV